MGSAAIQSPPKRFRGAFLRLASGFSIPNNTTTYLEFDTAVFDTDGFFDPLISKSEMIVPSGVKKIKVSVGLYFPSVFSANCAVFFRVAGGTKRGEVAHVISNTNFQGGSFETGIIEVSAGDKIEVSFEQNSGSTQTLSTARFTWWQVEVIE